MAASEDDVRARKRALRGALRRRRAGLVADDVAERSGRLVRHVQAHAAWVDATGVAAFVGVRGEPDTQPLLAAALAAGKRVFLPRVVSHNPPTMELAEIVALDELEPAGFGLLEPSHVEGRAAVRAMDAATIQLAIIPGLAFGRDGSRIGFGPGFYDRLLESVRTASAPVRIGVCFEDFLDPPEGPIPMEPHDVRVHAVATEAGVVTVG